MSEPRPLSRVQVVLIDPTNNWGPMTDAYNAFFEGVSPMPVRNYVGTTSFGSPGDGSGVLVSARGMVASFLVDRCVLMVFVARCASTASHMWSEKPAVLAAASEELSRRKCVRL